MPSPHTPDKGRGQINANGIDRIDSSIGYIESNCRPCCWRCNFAKGNMSEEEFFDMIYTIAAAFPKKAVIS